MNLKKEMENLNRIGDELDDARENKTWLDGYGAGLFWGGLACIAGGIANYFIGGKNRKNVSRLENEYAEERRRIIAKAQEEEGS